MNQHKKQPGRHPVTRAHTIAVVLLLSLLWLGNSGLYTPLLLAFGAVSVVFVVWLVRRMDLVDQESHPFHLSRGLPGYYVWLMKKVVEANMDVVACVWRGSGSISPCQTQLPCDLRSDISRVIYANSITLTPGTIAVDVGEDAILIHALTMAGRDELMGGEMQQRIARLEQ